MIKPPDMSIFPFPVCENVDNFANNRFCFRIERVTLDKVAYFVLNTVDLYGFVKSFIFDSGDFVIGIEKDFGTFLTFSYSPLVFVGFKVLDFGVIALAFNTSLE